MNATLRGTLGMMLVGALSAACASVETSDVPADLDGDELETSTEGTSYGGWTHSPFFWVTGVNPPSASWGTTFSRSSGTTTRGGGACLLIKDLNSTCSDDSTCITAAAATWGTGSYGYCYQGKCNARPGTQAELCIINPNRTPGTYYGLSSSFATLWDRHVATYGTSDTSHNHQALSCMTKTAGPNTACGGTDTSLYIRTLVQGTIPNLP